MDNGDLTMEIMIKPAPEDSMVRGSKLLEDKIDDLGEIILFATDEALRKVVEGDKIALYFKSNEILAAAILAAAQSVGVTPIPLGGGGLNIPQPKNK